MSCLGPRKLNVEAAYNDFTRSRYLRRTFYHIRQETLQNAQPKISVAMALERVL